MNNLPPYLCHLADVDVPQPDERSVMTYVAQFLHKYPGTYATEQPLSPTVSSPTSAAPAQDDLSVLESFLKAGRDHLADPPETTHQPPRRISGREERPWQKDLQV
ncbi:hypothetical protein MTO96_044773 [Rhipicephalus appendiculatus]